MRKDDRDKVFKQDNYVKIVGADGTHRYGYILNVKERGFTLNISLFDEGASKIAYDKALANFTGGESIDYIALLTDTERHLVPLLAAGYDTKEIGKQMNISPSTVRQHLRILRIKLRLDNRVQLIAFSEGLSQRLKD